MIVPVRDETLHDVFRCGICGKTFVRGSPNVSCCVLHAPGTCCHYTDRAISPDTVKKLNDVLASKEDPNA